MTVAPRLFYVDPPHTPRSSPAPASVEHGDDHRKVGRGKHDMKQFVRVLFLCSGSMILVQAKEQMSVETHNMLQPKQSQMKDDTVMELQ